MLYGWSGKILFIDLGSHNIHREETADYLGFIGGRGINQYLLFRMVDKQTAPLDPENAVILGSGPFVGTLVPAANRLAVDYKNVITNGVGSSNAGGQFAAEMKFAGYDHIVITGKADQPAYLYIFNDQVYFRDARNLRGKSTWETENQIKKQEREKAIKTLTIGPAGENLVKFACLMADRGRAAAYGGPGAIWGSKNLKAIAIRGTKSVRVAEPDAFLEKVRRYYCDVIEKSEMVRVHRLGGTLLAYQLPGENRPHGVRNMGDEYWSNDSILSVSREIVDRKFLISRRACFDCPVYCSGFYKTGDLIVEGFEANSFRAYASNLDIKDPEIALRQNALTNNYGLDGDQTSSVIAWAVECYENGILTKNDTDGLELRWGEGDNIIKLIDNIAYRRGFGNILAEGVYEAARIVGRGSERFGVMVKKTGLMEAAMRSYKSWALGIITSTKGGGHLRGAIIKDNLNTPPEISKGLFGIEDMDKAVSYKNKAALVVWQEYYKAVIDSIGVCALTSVWMDNSLYTPQDIVEFYRLVTGNESSIEELFAAGAKIQNLERVFNLLHAGFSRKDDMPPEKLFNPVSDGSFKGQRLDLKDWNTMLDEYYTLHQWDKETGLPTHKRLLELNLKIAIDKLSDHNLRPA